MLPIIRTDFKFRDIYSSLISSFIKNINSVEEFENYIADYTKKDFNVYFPKLRFGMRGAFEILFHKKNIGVPTYTCSVVPHSVAFSKNNIKFFDCNENNLTTEVFDKTTDSYIVTPWYGSPLNTELKHLNNSFGDFSHINLLNCENLDNHNFLAYFYTFGAGKPVSSIGGSIVSTNDKSFFNEIKNYRNSKYGLDIKNVYIEELLFSLAGAFISKLKLESLKIRFDELGMLNFLRESTDEIFLGKTKNKISNFQAQMVFNRIKGYDQYNKLAASFWSKILKDYPIDILNSSNWSNSHMNLRSIHRNSIKKVLSNVGVQVYNGSGYLNHKLKPYLINNKNIKFPNAEKNHEELFQVPINFSNKSFEKLQNKEKIISSNLDKLFSSLK